MSVVSGIQCDWCGNTGKLDGDQSLPTEPDGWCRMTLFYPGHSGEHTDLCPGCADAARKALAKAEKRCRTGKVQR
jgi:hypothetical protein